MYHIEDGMARFVALWGGMTGERRRGGSSVRTCPGDPHEQCNQEGKTLVQVN